MDMSVLVAAQGEVINQIAVHIENAANDTEQGVQQLVKATETQKKSRKVFIACTMLIPYRKCV